MWRSTVQPAARASDACASASPSITIIRWSSWCWASSASSASSAKVAAAPLATSTLRSQIVGVGSWKNAVPQRVGTARVATRACTTRSNATIRAKSSSVVAVVVVARPTDDDAVRLDRDLDGAVAGPVLGVDGVVLDGGVEPQPVALLAVVEGALEPASPALAAPAAPASPPAPSLSALVLVAARGVVLAFLRGRVRFRRLVLLGVKRGGHERVVLGAQIGLAAGGVITVAGVRSEVVLALEAPDVRHRDVQLVRDPRVRTPLAHPRP